MRDRLHEIAPGFKVKDFRTAVAADTALTAMKDFEKPKSATELVKSRAGVAEKVAAKLGNTPSVALGSYIPPEVFSSWETSAANNEQAMMIEKHAHDTGMNIGDAAKDWIGKNAVTFRENFNKKLSKGAPSGKSKSSGSQPRALGLSQLGELRGRAYRSEELFDSRDGFRPGRRRRSRFSAHTKENVMRQITLPSGRTVSVSPVLMLSDYDFTNALALYNHNHDEAGRFTDSEVGSHVASAKAHAASKSASKDQSRSSHNTAAHYHQEAADRAEENGDDHTASKHEKMAAHHEKLRAQALFCAEWEGK